MRWKGMCLYCNILVTLCGVKSCGTCGFSKEFDSLKCLAWVLTHLHIILLLFFWQHKVVRTIVNVDFSSSLQLLFLLVFSCLWHSVNIWKLKECLKTFAYRRNVCIQNIIIFFLMQVIHSTRKQLPKRFCMQQTCWHTAVPCNRHTTNTAYSISSSIHTF